MPPHTDALVRAAEPDASESSLSHVLVVGGTWREWSRMSESDWALRIAELGGQCSAADVSWLTVRIYERGPDPADRELSTRQVEVGGCTVIVDPEVSGRRRFVEAMRKLDPGTEVTEKAVASVLYAPADCEPDLVVVLGPSTQLPPSLVWELAYAELVFTPVPWEQFGALDLAAALHDFAGRQRRFGGLGDE